MNALISARTLTPLTETLGERATLVLKRAILSGEIFAGSKLRVHDLMRQYGLGATPVREGLNRLLSANLVQVEGQRGFRVVSMSPEDLRDLTFVRTAVETEALRLAIAQGDDRWEANVVAALHCLEKFYSSRGRKAHDGDAEFDFAHQEFHHALLAACNSPRLLELHAVLHDQAYRYRVAKARRGSRHPDNSHHQELAELALARKADRACDKLRDHISVTWDRVYGNRAI